ncbi:MAG: aminotransferase class III-fold pyridoxal phosphate-dependent enzyme, partial [Candidatus Methanofastidiosia archaeon]
MFQPEVLSKDEISKMLGEITQRELEIARKAHLTEFYDLVLFEGEPGGATVRDVMGRKFIDCTAQAWSLNVGYVQRDVIFAVSEQMKRLTHVRYGFPTIPRLKLAKKLIEISPEGLKKVSFNNEGGSLAIEAALKLAMINTKASDFIVTKTGYHGSTLSTLKASQEMPLAIRFKAFGSERFEKINFPYCYRCPYDMKECSLECARELEKILDEKEKEFAGFLIEPMQGPAGQIPAPKEYLKEVKRICS